MALKPRLGALVAFVVCGGLIVFEWLLRTRMGFMHPVALLAAGGGMAIGLLGLIWPEKTQLTAENKLQPLAHKTGMVGMGLGGIVWFLLK
jgi:uncharacterized membrane protein YccF (DUF307 family)